MNKKQVKIILPLVFVATGLFGAFTLYYSMFDEQVMFRPKDSLGTARALYPDCEWTYNSDRSKGLLWNYEYQGVFQEKGYYGYEVVLWPVVGGILFAFSLVWVIHYEDIHRQSRPVRSKKI